MVECPELEKDLMKSKKFEDDLVQGWWRGWFEQVLSSLIPYQRYKVQGQEGPLYRIWLYAAVGNEYWGPSSSLSYTSGMAAA